MSEIFVNKALIRDVFYVHFKPAALICIREVNVVYHLKKDTGKFDWKVVNGT